MTDKSELTNKIFLTSLIAMPGLLLGAVHPTILGMFLLAAAGFIGYLSISKSPPLIDIAGMLLMFMLGVTLLQIIPLPSSVVSFFAPETFDVRSRALSPLGDEQTHYMPISLDAPATLLEIGKLLLYLAVYLGVVHWTRRKGPTFVLRLVAFVGVVAAAIFLVHRIFMLNEVYGFYAPLQIRFTKDTISAPLINPNHLAGFLGIGTTVAIGSALEIHERSKRMLLVAIAALSGGTLMLTLSRGGIAAFVAGQLVFISLRVLKGHKKSHDSPLHASFVPMGLALSLGLGMFVAQDTIIGEFVGGDVRKLDLAFEGIPLIARFWPTGVGRGAFGVAFQMVSNLGANATATHAENAIIQLLADFGIIAGTIVIVTSLVLVGRFLTKIPRRADLAAAISALVAFGIHNLVDFNSEIPGVAVLATAVLGVLSGSRPTKRSALKIRYPRPMLFILPVLMLILGITAIAYLPTHLVRREEKRFSAAIKSRNQAMFDPTAIKEAMERHPASWFIPYIKGIHTFQHTTKNPLPWFARAIELNPHSAMTHYYVGSTLLRAGHFEQALLELRLAARSKPRLAHFVAKLLVSRVPKFKIISKIAVNKQDQLLLWPAFANQLASLGLMAETKIADSAILKIDPLNPRSLAREARRLNANNQNEDALFLAKRLSSHPQYGPSGIILTAEIQQQQQHFEKAARILKTGLQRHPNDPNILRALAWAEQKAGRFDSALKKVEKLKMTATTVTKRADYVLLEAQLFQAEGRIQATLARLKEARMLTPWNTSILYKIAGLSEQIGDKRRALDALRTLAREKPEDANVKKRLADLENRLKSENYLQYDKK